MTAAPAGTMPLWDAEEDRRMRRRVRRRARRRARGHRCADCERRISDPISLLYMLGSGCRRKRGIRWRRQRLRLGRTRVRDPGHIPGQLTVTPTPDEEISG